MHTHTHTLHSSDSFYNHTVVQRSFTPADSSTVRLTHNMSPHTAPLKIMIFILDFGIDDHSPDAQS